MPLAVVHRVSIPEPRTHYVHVETTVSAVGGELPAALTLFMPVWTPGSYLVREYARHIEAFEAEAPAVAVKARKNAWHVEPKGAASVVVRYRVYAHDLSVRTSHVDESHAFLVPAALFLGVEGHLDAPARVVLQAPPGWRCATPLEPGGGEELLAPDFDTLVDSPIELGTHREEAFEVLGKPHRFAIWPARAIGDADVGRLVADTRTLLETEAALFGGGLPYARYDFVLHMAARGRGGLEHRASSVLAAPSTSFQSRDAYLDLLSLIAHEAFHAWNVKRIRPAGLTPYRYDGECYTRLLWWFEGATSYYDWRVLAKSGLATVDEYLEHVAGEIAQLEQTPGRLVHALEETSFDAWIKLYRPDENSSNSTVSYYRKGELVCLLLDLEIAARTGGRVNLDHVLARLWAEHGASERPVPEDGLQAFFERAAGVPLGDLFEAWVRRPGELDFAGPFATVGLMIERSAKRSETSPACSLGTRVRSEGGRAVVSSVLRGSAAWRAGIDPGDEIVGIAGQRLAPAGGSTNGSMEGASVDAALRGRSAGDEVDVLVARDGRMLLLRAKLDPPRLDRVKIVPLPDAPFDARKAFQAWTGRPYAAWEKASRSAP
jgi:predicted metalloprotease with PDZ domain